MKSAKKSPIAEATGELFQEIVKLWVVTEPPL